MKKTMFLIFVFLFALPINALAYGVTSVNYNAQEDIYYVHFSTNQVSRFRVSSSALNYDRSFEYNGINYVTLTCNSTFTISFYGSSNNLLGSDTVTTTQISNESQSCQSSSDGGGDNGSGNCGCIFNTPGWNDYMDAIRGIRNAIPPAPNWGAVADTFRDSIVPKMISDLGNLLGRAPSPPPTPIAQRPNKPSPPPKLNDLDTSIDEPIGREAPGLGDSTFDKDDIKNEAPEIEFRDDPTDGFEINDPINGLPSQDEFLENVPEERDNPLPDLPEDKDNPLPNIPDETDNPIPDLPEDPDNPLPYPEQDEVDTGTPIPDGEQGTAPIPDNNGGISPPIPGDSGGSFPLPNDGVFNPPLPGGGGGQVPLPNQRNDRPPLPKGG